MKLTDEQAKEVESLVNSTIHNLVFLNHHADDNQLDEAREALAACELNLDRIKEILG